MSAETPDHVPCRNCGKPISWDDWCWIHDDSNFADCYITVDTTGCQRVGDPSTGLVGVLNPKIIRDKTKEHTFAEPIGEWT
jgi:hypothetical protein